MLPTNTGRSMAAPLLCDPRAVHIGDTCLSTCPVAASPIKNWWPRYTKIPASLPVLVELLAARGPDRTAPARHQQGRCGAIPAVDTPRCAGETSPARRTAPIQPRYPRRGAGGDRESPFNWLSVQSYIRTNTARGWYYHEKVRELMLRYLHSTTPGELAATHARLANFFDETEAPRAG